MCNNHDIFNNLTAYMRQSHLGYLVCSFKRSDSLYVCKYSVLVLL